MTSINLQSGSYEQLFHIAGKISQRFSPDDYIVLPLVILATLYVYNRGSLWPKVDPYAYLAYEVVQVAGGKEIARKVKSRNVVERIEETGARVVVFWGSQSGTAEGFALRLSRELRHRYDLTTLLLDLSEFEPDTIKELPASTIPVFIMSTYGEGDPSDNAQDFMSWTKSSGSTLFSSAGFDFAAFGCGNSNYREYNKTVDELAGFFLGKGAQLLLPVGKGNEATRATEEDFVEWSEDLMSLLKLKLGLKEAERAYVPAVDITFQDDKSLLQHVDASEPLQGVGSKRAASKRSDIVSLPVVSRDILANYAEEDRSCVKIVFDLSAHPQVKYKTGDHLSIWPENPEHEVSSLITLLGLENKRQVPITITPHSELDDAKVPSQTTVDALFRHHLEISGPVLRQTVLTLAGVAPTKKIKDVFEALGKDKTTFDQFIRTNYMTISRLLSYGALADPSASWRDLPLSVITDCLLPMKPRLYSISSSRIISPRHVALTVSVQSTMMPDSQGVVIPGLASTYLGGKEVTAPRNVWAQIRSSSFKLPFTSDTPLIMIAAGTGIAPFIAFIEERNRLKSIGREIGRMILLFGCQNEHDYLYGTQLRDLMDGPLKDHLTVITAFSRTEKGKTYVQHQVEKEKDTLTTMLLEEDAALYICGSTTMADGVNHALSDVVKTARTWSGSQFESWRAERKGSKWWSEDVWG